MDHTVTALAGLLLATVLFLVGAGLLLAAVVLSATPAPPSSDQRLADSEQQGQQQRPLHTELPDTTQE